MDDIIIQISATAVTTMILYFVQNKRLINANKKEIEKLRAHLSLLSYVTEIKREVGRKTKNKKKKRRNKK